MEKTYYSFEKKAIYNHIIEFIKENKVKSVLDIGAGHGYLIDLIKKYTDVKTIKGIDMEKKFIDKKIILKGDITKIPFKAKAFDMVVAKDVLEHVHDNVKALKEVIRVAKKYIFISVPAPFTDAAWADYQHKRPYTKTTLRHIAHDFELKILDIGSIKRHWPFRLIAKLWMQPIDDITVYAFFEK